MGYTLEDMYLHFTNKNIILRKYLPFAVQWVYNKNGTLMKTIDENGAESVFTYNQDKLVEKICNPEGEAIMLTYDGHKNLR